MTKKYRKGIFIVTYAIMNGRPEYLVLKRKFHWKGWEFPKGGIKKYELRRFAIRRELKEETGLKPLKIKSFRKKGVYKYKKECLDRPKVAGQTYKLYAVEVEKKKIILDKLEHSDFKWVGFSDAMKKLTWKNQKDCLKIVNEKLNK